MSLVLTVPLDLLFEKQTTIKRRRLIYDCCKSAQETDLFCAKCGVKFFYEHQEWVAKQGWKELAFWEPGSLCGPEESFTVCELKGERSGNELILQLVDVPETVLVEGEEKQVSACFDPENLDVDAVANAVAHWRLVLYEAGIPEDKFRVQISHKDSY